MPKRESPKYRARNYLKEHPSATNREVMDHADVSVGTVTAARAYLRLQGSAPVAFGDHKTKPVIVDAARTVTKATEGTFDVQTTADLNAAVAAELAKRDEELVALGEVDIGKLKGVLWRVINRNVDDRIVVAAASALARIQQEANARPLGPGKPLTRADALDRLAALNRPVGITLAFEAILKAFGITAVLEIVQKWIGGVLNARTESGESSPAPAEAVGAPDH